MNDKACGICMHFHSTGELAGYCDFILIAVKSYVSIITTPLMLESIIEKLNPDAVYSRPLVHRDFYCALYETLKFQEYIN